MAIRPLAPLTLPDQVTDARLNPGWYFGGFVGAAAQILGTSDPRVGFGFNLGYGKPEPKFRYKTLPSQMVIEVYADSTVSPGAGGTPANRSFATGFLVISRWFWPIDQIGNSMYGDIGWGFQYADRETEDLDNRINSTPVIGFGGLFPVTNGNQFMLGLRLLHISNGGTKKPNRGQNELFLTMGIKFR